MPLGHAHDFILRRAKEGALHERSELQARSSSGLRGIGERGEAPHFPELNSKIKG